jgi:hypothetical protein
MLTSSWVNISVANNGTWSDAFQFGTPGDTSWSFTGQAFKMEVKASRNDITPLFTLQSSNGTIIVDDVVQRILHFNQPDTAVQAALPVGEYVYDLVMFDTSVPPIRTVLMQGKVFVKQGVTED